MAARKSIFRTIAEAVNAELVTILTAEGRAVPHAETGFIFGNTPQFEWSHYPAVQWFTPQGSFVEEPKTGAIKPPVPDPLPQPLLVWRRQAHIWLWAANEEDLEHLVLRLPLAAERSAYQKFFHWLLAHTQDPSQELGAQLKNGVHVARIQVPLDIQANAEFDGETTLVTVTADKLRAAITDDLESDPDDETEWQPEQWSG